MLLLESGYVKLTDFGVSKHLEDINNCTFTSGTHGYMAPEIYLHKHKHGVPAEWFSVGVCLHEMVIGKRPWNVKKFQDSFSSMEEAQVVLSTSHIDRVDHITDECKSLLKALLQVDAKLRLGSNSFDDIIHHPWFDGFDWERLKSQEMTPPFLPDLTQANFDTGEGPALYITL